MKRLALGLLLLLAFSTSALATEVFHPHIFHFFKPHHVVVPPPPPPPPVVVTPPVVATPAATPASSSPQATSSGGSSQRFICWANPAGFFICAVIAAIVIDEVKRAIDGPACATMKPRQSWFGKTPDEPRLWRPLCKSRPAVVSVRG